MALMTSAGLERLVAASLDNARELITEAQLLLDNSHVARAYFLAVAAVEEIGKAIIAFEAQGRNLADSAVQSKLFKTLSDHRSKIICAFVGSLKTTEPTNMEEAVKAATEFMSGLRRGREPSMYTELLEDGSVQFPSVIIRPIAATDSIRLARHCLARAEQYLSTSIPIVRSQSDNFVYTMKKTVHAAIFDRSDFWWYHIDRMKAGQPDMSDSIYSYHNDYYIKGLTYQTGTSTEEAS